MEDKPRKVNVKAPDINAADDELLMSLVELAFARPAKEREACIENVCAGNPELFGQVRHYVLLKERMQGFLLDPLYPSAEVEQPFAPGDLLDGRFRIVREVAQGGMGIVYEAVDERLDRRIAIKCAKPGFHKRLPPEVRSASEISHPNVCRIFEIHTASTRQGEIDFITMEFLEGETLAERLRRGPLPKHEARAIALQLCAGLGEAHRNRVIHGDLKSNNVILASGASGAIRAVITDFGLARRPQTPAITVPSGPLGGTPDYMAPELWRGEKASVASDAYALGVLLYELACGRRPYGPDVTWKQRLTAKAPRAGTKWDGVLSRCLDPDPARRFRSVDEVALALEPPRSRYWLRGAAAAVILAVVSAAVAYQRARAPRETVRLAVLPFEAGSDTAALAASLARDAAGEIARIKGDAHTRFTAVPLTNILRGKVATTEKARIVLGATHALHGTLEKDNGNLVLHVFLTDTHSNVDASDWKAEYKPAQLHYAPVALAGIVTGTLHLPPLAATATVNAAARQDYSAGLFLLRRNSGVDAALARLERAAAADPDSPLTHAGLAEAQQLKFALTRDRVWLDRAAESVRQAEYRHPDLAPVHSVAGLLEYNTGRYEQAAADYRRAVEVDPANGDAYRRLGKVYEFNDQLDEALASYQKAAEVQPDYYKPFQDLGAFYAYRSNYAEAVRAWEKMVTLAPDYADAHFALAGAYRDWGRFADAEKEFRISIGLQDTSNAEHALGYTLMYAGKGEQAIACYLRALALGPETGLLWLNLGNAYQSAGSGNQAKAAFRRGLALDEKDLLQDPRNGITRSELAYLYARLGDRQRAHSEAAQALQLTPGDSDVRSNVAETYEVLGERNSTLAVLGSAPGALLAQLNRSPELAGLRRDPRFIQLMASKHAQ
jgi:tetratricopeptide (TPR) repeat protein